MGRLHTRYSPVRRSPPSIATRAAPRLACVKPAASVHPEPGSNSSLYIVFFNHCWLVFELTSSVCSSLRYFTSYLFLLHFFQWTLFLLLLILPLFFGTAKIITLLVPSKFIFKYFLWTCCSFSFINIIYKRAAKVISFCLPPNLFCNFLRTFHFDFSLHLCSLSKRVQK